MTEAKHTPGPWEHVKAERLSHDAPEIGPVVSPGGILGGPADDPSWVIEGEIDYAPNARLIAAAPDMLEALEQCRSLFNGGENHGSPEHKMVCDAIAKATGAA